MEIKGSSSERATEAARSEQESTAIVQGVTASSADVDLAPDNVFGKLALLARESTEQPAYFWQRQQAAIRSRIAVKEASRQPWTGLMWIAGLALLLIASLATVNRSVPPVAQNVTDPDQELLLTVEETVHSGVPEALAPAALLAEEMSDAESESSRKTKERSNAN
jgi:hypothetical protein